MYPAEITKGKQAAKAKTKAQSIRILLTHADESQFPSKSKTDDRTDCERSYRLYDTGSFIRVPGKQEDNTRLKLTSPE